MSTHNLCFEQKYENFRIFYLIFFYFFVVKFSVYLNRRVFVMPGVSLTLSCFVVYSTRRFVVCLSVCHFVLVFFSPFSIAITSLGEERANLSAFRTFVRFVLVWICRFPLPIGVWEGLRFVIVALPGLFSYLLLNTPVIYSTDRSKAVVPVLVLLFVALWFIPRGDSFYVLSCVILFLFFSPFSIAITLLGEERANLSAFRTFVRFMLVWFC